MDSGLWWLVATLAVVLAVAVVVTCVLVVAAARSRRRLTDELAASREELVTVQRRLDALSRRVPASPRSTPADQEFVITSAGSPGVPAAPEPDGPAAQQLTTRQFATVALGESLVTVAAFGHGLRRALSAENRNRIAFEMRREVRRARKQRRRDVKEARRHLRSRALDEDAA